MEVSLRDKLALRRIAAVLVALAVLAESAAGRSFPVRWFVLAILRQAEAAAWAFVVDVTQSDWPCFGDLPELGSRPADAACLALRFRALAAALGALLGLA